MGDGVHGVFRRHTEQPKTVLGFYAIAMGIMFSGVIGLIATLAAADTAEGLIPVLAIGAVLLFIAMIVGVFVLNVVSPERLMLGRVTGTEFAEIQRVQLGNSRSGERTAIVAPGGYAAEPVSPTALVEGGASGVRNIAAESGAIDGDDEVTIDDAEVIEEGEQS